MDPIELGMYLKGLRESKGLTLTNLSKLSGVSQPYLSQVERGKKGKPSPETLRKIADPLGVTYSELLIKAGHINEEELTQAVTDEFINFDAEAVLKRVEFNRKNRGEEIVSLLSMTTSKPVYCWGHALTENDRMRVIDVLRALFPDYANNPISPVKDTE